MGPLLEKCGEVPTSHGHTFLEMKQSLMLQYCTFLAYYLLLKAEGRKVENHPVIYKLMNIKTLLEKLRPLGLKLEYQIGKAARAAGLGEK
mmetsp:Transcript_6970/g.5223  ORF Transcript_6970/g.5223 Transcript_6970/m.5223 type:complete len:90 (+) Transcript_6970:383-652(+)